jgi:hypothetical protein
MGLGTSVFFNVAENAYLIVPHGAGHPAILSNVTKEDPSNILQVVGLFIILGYVRHLEICTIWMRNYRSRGSIPPANLEICTPLPRLPAIDLFRFWGPYFDHGANIVNEGFWIFLLRLYQSIQ